jgi:EAL domain-containing protein (putative c-di-GMP-specific phosphodiesterase class I)
VQTKLQLNPQWICFEITETAAITNLSHAQNFITRLKQIGFRFALDDFGSGMSSFAYLRELNIDFLKIDGAFVKQIDQNRIDYAMVSSINQIGQLMGIQTIAEFVENDHILELIKALQIDFAQGYGIDKPKPLPLSSSVKLKQNAG